MNLKLLLKDYMINHVFPHEGEESRGNGKPAKGLKIPWTEFKKVSTENLYTGSAQHGPSVTKPV